MNRNILIFISGVVTFVISLTLIPILFINCSTPPLFDLFVPGYNDSCIIIKSVYLINKTYEYPWNFLIQVNGWNVIHYITNFYIAIFSASLILYSKKLKVKKGYRYYISCIANTTFKGVLGEIMEATIVVVSLSVLVYVREPSNWYYFFQWINSYWTETVGDIVLSDLIQCILASALVCAYVFTEVLKPTSILILNRSFKMIVFRSIVFFLLCLSGFLIVVKKNYGGSYDIPLGFYYLPFLMYSFLSILWIEDRICSRKNDKFSEKEVDKLYIFLIVFLIVQWIAAFNLMVPGLFTSNLASVILFLVMLFRKWLNKEQKHIWWLKKDLV